MKTHKRDLRLFVNAGIAFPKCVKTILLDMRKTAWKTSGNTAEVNCKHCLKSENDNG